MIKNKHKIDNIIDYFNPEQINKIFEKLETENIEEYDYASEKILYKLSKTIKSYQDKIKNSEPCFDIDSISKIFHPEVAFKAVELNLKSCFGKNCDNHSKFKDQINHLVNLSGNYGSDYILDRFLFLSNSLKSNIEKFNFDKNTTESTKKKLDDFVDYINKSVIDSLLNKKEVMSFFAFVKEKDYINDMKKASNIFLKAIESNDIEKINKIFMNIVKDPNKSFPVPENKRIEDVTLILANVAENSLIGLKVFEEINLGSYKKDVMNILSENYSFDKLIDLKINSLSKSKLDTELQNKEQLNEMISSLQTSIEKNEVDVKLKDDISKLNNKLITGLITKIIGKHFDVNNEVLRNTLPAKFITSIEKQIQLFKDNNFDLSEENVSKQATILNLAKTGMVTKEQASFAAKVLTAQRNALNKVDKQKETKKVNSRKNGIEFVD